MERRKTKQLMMLGLAMAILILSASFPPVYGKLFFAISVGLVAYVLALEWMHVRHQKCKDKGETASKANPEEKTEPKIA